MSNVSGNLYTVAGQIMWKMFFSPLGFQLPAPIPKLKAPMKIKDKAKLALFISFYNPSKRRFPTYTSWHQLIECDFMTTIKLHVKCN